MESKNIKWSLPKIDLNVTNNCNFRCIHCCFNSGERDMNEFSPEELRKILINFKELGGWRIDITGGEPLVRKDIFEIIKIAKELGLKTELVTNGSLLTKAKLKKYKEIGLDGIAISLDGSTYDIHHAIRGVDSFVFQKILGNIERSAEMGFYTKINTVVFSLNLPILTSISDLAISLGAKEHGFYFFSTIGRGSDKSFLVADPVRWLEIIRNDLVDFADQIKFSFEVPIIEPEFQETLNTKCFLKDPWHLQMLPSGSIYPCAIMVAYDKPLANLHERNIKEIWNDEALWDGTYYDRNVLPLFSEFGGCVNYPTFSYLVKSKKYSFVCLCRKFTLEGLAK